MRVTPLDTVRASILKLGLPTAIVDRFRSPVAPASPEEALAAEEALLARLQSLPPETIQRFRAAAEKAALALAAKATREAAAALPPSPEDVLREEEERAALLERREADEKAWTAALVTHGKGRVGFLETPRGRVILRAMTVVEADDKSARLAAIESYSMRVQVGREGTLDLVVPSGSHPGRDAVRETLGLYPGLWSDAYDLRDALARGEVEALMGKA